MTNNGINTQNVEAYSLEKLLDYLQDKRLVITTLNLLTNEIPNLDDLNSWKTKKDTLIFIMYFSYLAWIISLFIFIIVLEISKETNLKDVFDYISLKINVL